MWEAAAVPRDPLWIIHTGVTVGGNWEHLSSHKCGSCIFFFFFYKCIVNSINCKLLGTTSLTYGGLELYGSIELNSLGFHFENVFFFPLLNSSHMWIEGPGLNEEETYHFKSPQLSFGPWPPPLRILCFYCLVNPHNKSLKSAPRFKDEKSKFQEYVALKHGRKIPSQPPCPWINIKQYGH